MPERRGGQFPGLQIPDPGSAIPTRRHEALIVGAEAHRSDEVRMAQRRQSRPACG